MTTAPAAGAASGEPVTPAASESAAAVAYPAQGSPSPSTLEDRLAQARSANTRLGTGARPAKPPANGGQVASTEGLHIESSGSLKEDGKTLRVVSARSDLSGQRELAWVADNGEPYGGARCSQSIQMSNNVVPKKRPTLLVCWRTSAKRSAYTLLVDLDKKPSKAESLEALNRAWKKLG